MSLFEMKAILYPDTTYVEGGKFWHGNLMGELKKDLWLKTLNESIAL